LSASFFAEFLKLRKRPAVWILGGLWLAVTVLFLYFLPALLFTTVAANVAPEIGANLEAQLSALTPENLAAHLLRFLFPALGTAVALVLGALAAGSEYSWGTLTTVLSQRPGRLEVLRGKLLALANLLFLFVLVAFLAGAASSLAVALASDRPPAPPPAAELLEGLGAGTLILALWAAFGFALATLFRSTALAVGLGLIYAFAIEPVFAGLSTLSKFFQTIAELLPGVNTSVLSVAFFQEGTLDPARAALVMLLYIAVFVLIAALAFRQRDVT
jgi:ABC-2 type transport system permease protein